MNDVSLNIPGQSHGTLYLAAEFGWGDKPYYWLCEQLSPMVTGSESYKYASAYGYATEFGLGSWFVDVSFIVEREGRFELSDSYPNAVYDSGFSCTDTEYIY